MYENGPCGVFFSMSFSKYLDMKKIPSCTFVRLVKILSDIRFITMTNMGFSFLGLANLLGRIHPKDELTVKAYIISFKLAIKN